MNSIKVQYWIFLILTVLYFFILNYFFGVTLVKVKALSVNELGDFLAGSFSPLAFLFLILGYLQTNKGLSQNTEALTQQAIALQQQSEALKLQADELKISNEALKAQAEELKRSSEQQIEQVRVAYQQLEYTKQKDRDEQKRLKKVAQPILDLRQISKSSNQFKYRIFNTGATIYNVKTGNSLLDNELVKGKFTEFSTDKIIENLVLTYTDALNELESIGFVLNKDTNQYEITEVIEY